MTTSLLKSALVAVAGFALCATSALNAQTTPVATAPAAAPATTDSSASASKTDHVRFSGTIKSVSDTSVVVTTDKGDLTLAVDAKTRVGSRSHKGKLSDLTAGEAANGAYAKNDDGTMTLVYIHGTPASATPKQ